MDNYEKYMNNSDIINELMVLCGIHVIRFMLQDKTKDLMPVECAKFTRKEAWK